MNGEKWHQIKAQEESVIDWIHSDKQLLVLVLTAEALPSFILPKKAACQPRFDLLA